MSVGVEDKMEQLMLLLKVLYQKNDSFHCFQNYGNDLLLTTFVDA